MYNKTFSLNMLAFLAFILISCGTAPVKTSLPLTDEEASQYISLTELQDYIDTANTQLEPERSRELLNASRSLLHHNEYEWLISVLEQIFTKFLSYDEKACLLYTSPSPRDA